MSERVEFIKRALQEGVNFSKLCKEFEISRKTGYKWLNRFREEGADGLVDRSRRPKRSPNVTPKVVEQHVLEVRERHPAWGGRKIHARLKRIGHEYVPSPSTITAILHRNDKVDPEESVKHKPWKRFEKKQSNEMWQMDFKGYFDLQGKRCHPLTILDDHSRYLLGLKACRNQQRDTVKGHLINVFREYGMPDAFLVDNGSPWGGVGQVWYYTGLNAWMIRLGILIVHSRPFHPQTLGKDERLHRTLKAEVLKHHTFGDFHECQSTFDSWQQVYNYDRTHEALGMDVPTDRYTVSSRSFPEHLPAVEYPSDDVVRKVCKAGKI